MRPLSWTGKLYERGGGSSGGWKAQGHPCHMACEPTNSCGEWSDMSMLDNLALNQHATAQTQTGRRSATTRLLRGKIRYWKWVRTKHWNCLYLGLPSHMLCLASSQIWVCCFLKDFGWFSLLVLYVPFILQYLALHFVLVWQAKKRSPIFTRASKFKQHLNLLNPKKPNRLKPQTVLRTTLPIFQKKHHSFGMSTKKLNPPKEPTWSSTVCCPTGPGADGIARSLGVLFRLVLFVVLRKLRRVFQIVIFCFELDIFGWIKKFHLKSPGIIPDSFGHFRAHEMRPVANLA